MRLATLACVLGVLFCGCGGYPLVSLLDAPTSPAGGSPEIEAVGSLLASASEAEWRRDIDAGPMEFDEVGMPVTAKPGAGGIPAKDRKARRFGARIGTAVDVSFHENQADMEAEQDGPIGGVSFSMGPRAGRFAFELGYDFTGVEGWYRSSSGGFSSTIESARLDLVLFLSGATSPARLYLLGGLRTHWERVEMWGPYGEDLEFNNTAEGFTAGAGFLIGRFDFRVENVEVDAEEDGVDFTYFTMTFRF